MHWFTIKFPLHSQYMNMKCSRSTPEAYLKKNLKSSGNILRISETSNTWIRSTTALHNISIARVKIGNRLNNQTEEKHDSIYNLHSPDISGFEPSPCWSIVPIPYRVRKQQQRLEAVPDTGISHWTQLWILYSSPLKLCMIIHNVF